MILIMNKKVKVLIPAIAIILASVLILSLATCGKQKKNDNKNNSSDLTSSATDNVNSETSRNESTGDSKTDDGSKTIWDRINDVIKSDDNDSNSSNNNDSKSDTDGDTNDNNDTVTYKSPIQAVGDAAQGNNRSINIKTSKIVFNDFMSIGTNMFTSTLTSASKKTYGFNETYFELQKKQIRSLNITTGRLIVSVEQIVTDTEKDPQRKDWKNNKDYINYINGVYDFENEYMKSMYKYLDAYKEVGTEVNLNFGWNSTARVSMWLNQSVRGGAPRDLDAFAKAAAALADHLINEKGYTNIKRLTFYNEPSSTYSLATLGDKKNYYSQMINKTYEQLKKRKLNNKIKIFAAEHTTINYNMLTSWYDFFKEKCGSKLGGITHHSYYDPSANIDYNVYYDFYTKMYGHLKSRLQVTEYMDSYFDTRIKDNDRWNYSDASQLICSANTGVTGLMHWEGIGGTEPTVPFWSAGGYISYVPRNKETAQKIGYFYNGCSLINNYVGTYADVLYVDWNGKDIRTSAFKRSDGEYTIIVEANNCSSERELTLKFDKKLGKKVYRYSYDYSERAARLNGYDSIIPLNEKVYNNVGTTIKDKLSEKYRVYIYTTATPKKQIAFDNVWNECKKDDSIKLSANLLDCNANDEMVWSVLRTTGSAKGVISNSGEYTPAQSAKPGDLIAIKASLKNDNSIYSVALVSIK